MYLHGVWEWANAASMNATGEDGVGGRTSEGLLQLGGRETARELGPPLRLRHLVHLLVGRRSVGVHCKGGSESNFLNTQNHFGKGRNQRKSELLHYTKRLPVDDAGRPSCHLAALGLKLRMSAVALRHGSEASVSLPASVDQSGCRALQLLSLRRAESAEGAGNWAGWGAVGSVCCRPRRCLQHLGRAASRLSVGVCRLRAWRPQTSISCRAGAFLPASCDTGGL